MLEVRIGDIGTRFILVAWNQAADAVLPINDADVLEIDFRKPDGSVVTKTASLVTDGTDGQFYYDSVEGFLDAAGAWSAEGYIEKPSWQGHTSRIKFSVADVLLER
jgi:hypothetical protein